MAKEVKPRKGGDLGAQTSEATATMEPPDDEVRVRIHRVVRVTDDTATPIRACKQGCSCLQVSW